MASVKSKVTTLLYSCVTLMIVFGAAYRSAEASPPRMPAHAEYSAATTSSPGILSIPAAAFTSYRDGYDYQNHGRYLKHFHDENGLLDAGVYYAPVNLPDGAVVTRVTYHYYLTYTSGYAGDVYLQRSKLDQDDYSNMASKGIYPPPTGFKSASTDEITNPTIDNSQYEYWVAVVLPVSQSGEDQQIWNCGVVIEYTPPETFSGVMTIPAAAFIPYQSGYDYENDGRFIFTTTGSSGVTLYVAPVKLPDGALVHSMTFHYYDNNPSFNVTARLLRKDDFGNPYQLMAFADSSSASGWASSSDNAPSYPVIGSMFHYWVEWDIPAWANLKGCAVVINYDLTSDPYAISFLSIPAASFKPFEGGYEFNQLSGELNHVHSAGGGFDPGLYYAQVNLPQGASVTKMYFYYYEVSLPYGTAILQRTRFSLGNYVDMASIVSTGSNYSIDTTTDISHPVIDNSLFAYWVVWTLPATSQFKGLSVLISYAFQTYLPILLR
jgi:hypothetical protein